MKVLITGAAGFLGRSFLRYHLTAGDDVTAIDDFSAESALWPLGDRPYKALTIDAGAFFKERTDSFDLAYHFAAPVGGRVKIEGDPLYNADSLRLDSAFFRWAPGKVGTAVYPSSSAVYGVYYQSGAGVALFEELFEPESSVWARPDEMYGFTKMAGEVLAAKAAQYELNTLCIRPFSGYGEEQSLDYPMPSICRRAARHEDPLVVWGQGTQTRDFIHVEDIVWGTQAALEAGVTGYRALNLGSGIPTSFIQVARMAAVAAGYDPVVVTDTDKPQGVTSRYANIERMFSIYLPRISLEEGIARMVDAHKSGGQ